MLTVAQALELGGLAKGRVVAGSNGLERVVNWLQVLEAPDIVNWMMPGELLITNLYSIREKTEVQRELVRRMNDVQAAGFIIKIRRWVESIPQCILEEAEACGLPVIELPPEVSYYQVTQPIYAALLNQQLAISERSEQIHRRLTEVMLAGSDLGVLCRTIARLLESPVLILGDSGEILVDYGITKNRAKILSALSGSAGGETLREARDRGGMVKAEVPARNGPFRSLVMPVRVAHEVLGFLVIIPSGRELDDLDRKTLEHGALIMALHVVKERELRAVERRLKGDFLQELLAGKLDLGERAVRRSQVMGLDLTARLTVVVFSLREESLVGYTDEERYRLLSRFTDVLAATAGVPALVSQEGSNAVALLQVGTKKARLVIEACRRRIAEVMPGLQPDVGIGGSSEGTARILKSHEEALQALTLGKKLSDGQTSVFTYDNLGIYRILARLVGVDEVNDFVRERLAPLIEYDRAKGSILIPTLEKYFHCHQNVRETASELYMHRNTVHRRLQQVEGVTGLSLGNPEDCFVLEVGLRLLKLQT